MEKSKVYPILYSLPTVEKLNLPSRAEMMPKIESGEIDHLDFRANVFGTGAIKNPYKFRAEDLPRFAASFEGKPFLRNHDQSNIDSRDGTILGCALMEGVFVQDVRLTTRRGMLDYIEGKIDRFSIGWDYQDAICTICGSSFFDYACSHHPGRSYKTVDGQQMCELLFVEPSGIETSAVNVPAVENTGIVAALDFKQQAMPKKTDEDAGEYVTAGAVTNNPGLEVPAGAGMVGKVVTARLEFIERWTILGRGEIMNIRELLSKRAECLKSARALATLADEGGRDFTDVERAEFSKQLDDAEQIGAQIENIQADRARLSAVEANVYLPASEAVKPEAVSVAKLIKRQAFEALAQNERAAYMLSGGKVED